MSDIFATYPGSTFCVSGGAVVTSGNSQLFGAGPQRRPPHRIPAADVSYQIRFPSLGLSPTISLHSSWCQLRQGKLILIRGQVKI